MYSDAISAHTSQQRDQGRRDGRVVGRLGAGHALDGAGGAKLFLVLGELLFGGIAEESRDLAAAGRDGAERRPDEGGTDPGGP